MKVVCICVKYCDNKPYPKCPFCVGKGKLVPPEKQFTWGKWHRRLRKNPWYSENSRLGHGVQLTDEQEELLTELQAQPFVPNLRMEGHCAGCGIGIPAAYLSYVTKWKGGRPVEEWCQACGKGRRSQEAVTERRVHAELVNPTKMPAKEVARKLMKVMTKTPRSARVLAKRAHLEYALIIKKVLRVLRKAGKLKKYNDEGVMKWALPET